MPTPGWAARPAAAQRGPSTPRAAGACAAAAAPAAPPPATSPAPACVHLPALLGQMVVCASVPPPRTVLGELPQLGKQRRVITSPRGLVTLRGTVLADHPTCPALADAETVAQHHDRPAPAGWAYECRHARPRAAAHSGHGRTRRGTAGRKRRLAVGGAQGCRTDPLVVCPRLRLLHLQRRLRRGGRARIPPRT